MTGLAFAVLAIAATSVSPVVRVIDGDTLVVVDDGVRTVRVLGIDCPEAHANAKCWRDEEMGHGACLANLPLGRAAAARARELLVGQLVTLEPSVPGAKLLRDRYGRTLAYVRLEDGRDFGLAMVTEGYCADFGWKYPHPRGAEYVAAERARNADR